MYSTPPPFQKKKKNQTTIVRCTHITVFRSYIWPLNKFLSSSKTSFNMNMLGINGKTHDFMIAFNRKPSYTKLSSNDLHASTFCSFYYVPISREIKLQVLICIDQ